MYEYKYEEANMDSMFHDGNYKMIIEEQAKKGWKLVQLIPIKFNPHGIPKLYEIIFERKMIDEQSGLN